MSIEEVVSGYLWGCNVWCRSNKKIPHVLCVCDETMCLCFILLPQLRSCFNPQCVVELDNTMWVWFSLIWGNRRVLAQVSTECHSSFVIVSYYFLASTLQQYHNIKLILLQVAYFVAFYCLQKKLERSWCSCFMKILQQSIISAYRSLTQNLLPPALLLEWICAGVKEKKKTKTRISLSLNRNFLGDQLKLCERVACQLDGA